MAIRLTSLWVLIAAWSFGVRTAEACVCINGPSILAPIATDTDVPANTKISFSGTDEVELRDANGVVIDGSVETIALREGQLTVAKLDFDSEGDFIVFDTWSVTNAGPSRRIASRVRPRFGTGRAQLR